MSARTRNQPGIWEGTPAQNARRWLRTHTDWPTTCARCGTTLQRTDPWILGHILDRQAYPEHTWDRDNWQVECTRCSTSTGATQGNTRRRLATVSNQQPPTGRLRLGFVSGSTRSVPETLSAAPRSPGDMDGLPRVFSGPHPEAVGSRGDEMVAHAEARRGGPLRWFQWVSAQRRYEVKADGSWCWPLVFESTPRQQGKSVTLAEDAAWFCGQAPVGDVLVLHAAHRVKTSLDVQSELWHWAEASGFTVHRLLGDSRIVWPSGARWATVAIDSAYGRRPWRLLMDEAWAMNPVKFWNSLFPALGDRDSPQALFWSTANPDDRGLVADLQRDERVCRMEWGALPGEDPLAEGTWRASSAFWGSGRLELMRIASSKPGFAEEWLNIWPVVSGSGRWVPEFMSARADGHVGAAPEDAKVAVEVSVDGSRWAVAAAWGHSKGRVRARVWSVDSAASAARVCGSRRVWAHAAVVRSPQIAKLAPAQVNTSEARAATTTLRTLLTDGRLTVAGVDDGTWAGVRTIPADGGDVISGPRSTVDVSAIKALSWACWALETAREQSGALVM